MDNKRFSLFNKDSHKQKADVDNHPSARSRSTPREAVEKKAGLDLRVLVLAHSHPKLTHGGAEIAADALCRALKEHYNAKTWFFGCSGKSYTARLGANLSQPFADDDYVYQTGGAFDWFKFANRDTEFPAILKDVLTELQPNIVHFHHYAQFGVEAFSIVKRVLPDAIVVLTLHEYLAICHNHGQMVKTETFRLCEKESPAACTSCFSQIEARDFFLRKRYIQNFFEDVDLFIAPSDFLAQRYIDWGLPASKIALIENIPPAKFASSQRSQNDLSVQEALFVSIDEGDIDRVRLTRPIRVGFFGQMSPLKGISVILGAAKDLAEWKIDNILIELFGDYSNQPFDFQKVVKDSLANLGSNVKYHGPYENDRVHTLMQSVDVVLVPSVWWENSPVVIQEAFTNGRPVICSNIGGMAEKVQPGIDGLWFEAGSSRSLAELLRDLSRKPSVLTHLSATVRQPVSAVETVAAHVEAYLALQKRKAVAMT